MQDGVISMKQVKDENNEDINDIQTSSGLDYRFRRSFKRRRRYRRRRNGNSKRRNLNITDTMEKGVTSVKPTYSDISILYDSRKKTSTRKMLLRSFLTRKTRVNDYKYNTTANDVVDVTNIMTLLRRNYSNLHINKRTPINTTHDTESYFISGATNSRVQLQFFFEQLAFMLSCFYFLT